VHNGLWIWDRICQLVGIACDTSFFLVITKLGLTASLVVQLIGSWMVIARALGKVA